MSKYSHERKQNVQYTGLVVLSGPNAATVVRKVLTITVRRDFLLYEKSVSYPTVAW